MTGDAMGQAQESAGAIFGAAIDLPESQRAAFIERACAGDEQLRKRIEALVRAHHSAGAFMENPPRIPSPGIADLALTNQSGQRIGPYKLLQEIGEGGCGVVYMAEQEHPIRRRVALKIIKQGMDTRKVIVRFEAERQALALMDHPNIARVLDAGATESGRPFFVMELVAGERITGYCDHRRFSTAQRLELFVHVCRAVQHAHQKGIIHRDLKPSNVLVTEQDGGPVPKVIDFGIAKATGDVRLTDKTLFTAFERFVGTPAYMSPEHAGLGRLDIDTRSDIYSLGVLLYELLSGHPPFDSDEFKRTPLDQVLQTIREKDPPRPSTRLTALTREELFTVAERRQVQPPKLLHLIRGDLDWIVMKALEKDRTRRYETANGLARDIERHLRHEPVVARPASPLYLLQKTIRRNKLAFVTIGTIATTLVAGILASNQEALRARRAERNTEVARQFAVGEARRADAAAIETQRTLAVADLSHANQLIAEEDGTDAIPYLVRILSSDPANRAALTRLATLLTYHSWYVPTLTLKHTNWVHSVQFSPDGARIVTSSYDKTAQVWDARTGQPLGLRLEHAREVFSAQFSPDGQRVVTACADGKARIWDAQSSRLLAETSKHDGEVAFAQFSPDGTRIVTASSDKSARIWDATTGRPLAGPMKHRKPVRYASFSPNGERVVTASDDNTAMIWNAESGTALAGPLEHEGSVLCAEFSPDGERIVTSSSDRSARIWDATTGQPMLKPLQHLRAVDSAHFSRDGRRILTASVDGFARVWDARTGELLIEPLRHPAAIWSADFSPDGQRIVTASADFIARVWDLQMSPPLNEPFRHSQELEYAEFSPDGRLIVTASDDGTARVWDAQTGQAVNDVAMIHSNAVLTAEFSPDGTRVVTASVDQTARIWHARTGRLIVELKHDGPVCVAEFSPDGQRVLTASGDHTAQIWDAQDGKPLTPPLRHDNLVTDARFSPDGTRVVTASWDYTAKVWDARTGKLITQLRHDEAVQRARFSPDGRRVVTASADWTARLWNAQTGSAITPPLPHTDYVLWAEFSPDGSRVATAGRHGAAHLWDARTGLAAAEPLAHEQSVESARFSPDGTIVVTASTDGTARLWDARTGQPLSEPLRHAAKIYMAQFSRDGRRIVTASDDHTARVWDVGLAPSRCPDWLFRLAEALSGSQVSPQGILQPSSLDRAKTIEEIGQYLRHQPDNQDGILWGRWLLADRSTRTISPWSAITVPRYIEHRIEEGTAASLDEAAQLVAGNTELSGRISQLSALFDQTNRLGTLH
jgi:eukaryotic-like serine/threonine-protein kinase